MLLNAGTNDAHSGVPVVAPRANVGQRITLLRQKNPKVRVMVAQLVPTANATFNLASGLVDYNKNLPSLAAGRISTAASPVTVVDSCTGYNGVVDNQPDGIRSKVTGERTMAAARQRVLAPVLAAMTPATRPATVAATPKPNALTGTLEAEHYHTGGENVAYRSDGVDIAYASSIWSYAVTRVQSGEWLEYAVDAPRGARLSARLPVLELERGQLFELQVDGRSAATPRAGSYDACAETSTQVRPAKGAHRILFTGAGGDFDSFALM